MVINIDRKNGGSVFKQLVNQISMLIENGDLHEGFILPSSRSLAGTIGVNRSTVVQAYEELWALGYLESTSGSYTKVRKRRVKSRIVDGLDQTATLWGDTSTINYISDLKHIDDFLKQNSSNSAGDINLSRLEPDFRLVNRALINRCFREALNRNSKQALGYSHPRGYKPLRESIASHMRLHGVETSDENILITNGAQNSLQLIFQALISKDDIIAAESPTYSMLIPLIKYFGCTILEIPVNEDGMDIPVLREYVKTYKVKMLYTMPSFHNPTSATMPQSKREELLELCENNKIIIVEDSIEEELKYFGKVHMPIKSMDSHEISIYLGSFSKILAPGFRLGWIIANKECINRLTALKTIFDLSSNSLTQIMLHQFCNDGHYELHIRKLMRAYKSRMKTALKALRSYMPADKVCWSEPLGGFLIWLKLNISTQNLDLENHFRRYGVLITDGGRFFYSPTCQYYIRLSISRSNEAEITEGIKRMALAINDIK